MLGGLFVVLPVVEGDGRLTVFIPGSPNPASGSVQIVPKDKVRLLTVRITGLGSALQQWSVGAQKCSRWIARHRQLRNLFPAELHPGDDHGADAGSPQNRPAEGGRKLNGAPEWGLRFVFTRLFPTDGKPAPALDG